MPENIAQKSSSYWRRIGFICPLALFIVFGLFFTSDYVPFSEIDKRFGWKGELHVLPEITIIPDHSSVESFVPERKRRPMTSMDLDVIDETANSEGAKREKKTTEKIDKPVPADDDGLYNVETRSVHTDIPYSEDYIILRMVQPEYPPVELMNGIEGEVTLEVLINEQGTVDKAWVLNINGSDNFEAASMDAIKQFIFQPPMKEGKPASMSIRFQIKFRIVG